MVMEELVLDSVPDEQNEIVQLAPFAKRVGLKQGERWFVARVHTNRENGAQFNLDRLGFRSFAPRVKRTIRHARKSRTILAPLFPGYVFIILDLSRDRWRTVNSTFGVAALIMGVEQPLAVPHGVVEAIMTQDFGVVRSDDNLKIGQQVRILSGPFAEALCRLVHLDDRGRVRVLLELMGTEVTAKLDRAQVAPAA
jgi:transcription antitermination factor NusG